MMRVTKIMNAKNDDEEEANGDDDKMDYSNDSNDPPSRCHPCRSKKRETSRDKGRQKRWRALTEEEDHWEGDGGNDDCRHGRRC